MLAFVGGLYLSTLLGAYAACEIEVVSRSVGLASLGNAGEEGFTLETLMAGWEEANDTVGRRGRTKDILKDNRIHGHWMEPALRNAVIELSKRRR